MAAILAVVAVVAFAAGAWYARRRWLGKSCLGVQGEFMRHLRHGRMT